MRELFVKPNLNTEVSASASHGREKTDKTAALAALANTFKDLIQKVGANADTGLSAIAERQGITAVSKSDGQLSQHDDQSGRKNASFDEHQVARNRDDNRDHHNEDHSRSDREVDRDSKANTSLRDERNAREHTSDDISRDDGRSSDAVEADNASHIEELAGNEHSGDEEENNARIIETSNKNGVQSTEKNESVGSKDLSDPISIANAMSSSALSGAGLNVAQSIAGTAVQNTIDDGVETAARETSILPSLAAAASTAKNSITRSAQSGSQQTNIGQSAPHVANNKEIPIQSEDIVGHKTNMQQQANQLANSLRGDARLKMTVSITNEAENITSRPISTLASAASLSSESKKSGQANSQQNSHGTSQNQAHIPQATNAQLQNGLTQGQNQQSKAKATQAQVTQAAGINARGPSALSNTLPNTSTTTSSLGSESLSSNSSISSNGTLQQTQQIRENFLAQQTGQMRGATSSPTASEQVSVRIPRALQAGNDRISIRLNPAELGRVEVKMELAFDGRMTAVVTADNRDTLDLLKRDASELQKALQEGGIDLDSGNLNFNLRGEERETAAYADNAADDVDVEDEQHLEAEHAAPGLILDPNDIDLGEARVDVRA